MEARKLDKEGGTTASKVLSLNQNLNLDSVSGFIESWKEDFTDRMLASTGSKKREWGFDDAATSGVHITDPLDKLLLEYVDYINSNPLKSNDFFKYCDSYFKGKKLDSRYFRHDKAKLEEYYKKIDRERETARDEDREPVNHFNKAKWEAYVLFMMLKLKGLYSSRFDPMFNIKRDQSREYNPLTSLDKVLRQSLPFEIKEYDIIQAYPSFIFLELGMEPFDVYTKIDKVKFNTLLNLHKDVKGSTLEKARKDLAKVFGSRADEVLTETRYNERGRTFKDFAKYEKQYIEKFVQANNLNKYVRLHDSVVVPANVKCEHLEFGKIRFKEKTFVKPKVENEIITFYNDDEKTEPARYKRFFEQENFIRISEQGKDELTVIKNENKVLKPFNHSTDTLNFLSGHINEYDTTYLENVISYDAQKIKSGFLLMTGEPLRLHRDTKDEVFIPFKNGVAKITTDAVEMIPYHDESIGFFAEVETLKHEFDYSEEHAVKSTFRNFLFNAVIGRECPNSADDLTAREANEIASFCSMIGYLISNYKNPAKAFAIILSDAGADDNSRNGRRGKSLIQEALKRMRVSVEKAGDSFDTGYRHKFADLKKEHDVYIIDDAPAGFKYNSFYSEIKTGISPERKGVEADFIPFELTPKFVISTNYAVRYNKDDASTNDRFLEFQFSDFWNINNRPNDYFGENFFTDWNAESWNQFYCFMTECVQMFLADGLTQIPYDKTADNYRAYFHNDTLHEEMQRILKQLEYKGEFTVSDFLREYQNNDNPLRYDKLFHKNNVKELVNIYIKQNNVSIQYVDYNRKWVFITQP